MALNCSKATSLLLLLLAICNLIGKNYAITCLCDDCLIDSECESEDAGAACYARISVDHYGNVHRQKRCYSSASAQRYCNFRTSILVIECCFEDYCNKDLSPQLLNDTAPITTPAPHDNPTPVIEDPMMLDPNPGPTDDNTHEGGPVFITPLLCHKHNTKKPNAIVTHCTAPVTGGCYHLTRRSPNGTVEFERYGCADTCVEEDRNRAIRKCCNTSWCNTPRIDMATTTTTMSLTSTSTLYSTISTANPSISSLPKSTLSNTISSSTTLVTVSTLSVSDYHHVTISSIELESTSKYVSTSTAKADQSTDVRIPSTTTLSTPLKTPPTSMRTLTSDNMALIHENSLPIYIAGSIILVIMLTVIAIILTVCIVTFYRYKMELKHEEKKGSVEHSTDTLVHGTVV